jgi:hypothetical protein
VAYTYRRVGVFSLCLNLMPIVLSGGKSLTRKSPLRHHADTPLADPPTRFSLHPARMPHHKLVGWAAAG